MKEQKEIYKKSLLEDVIPFWQKHSLDKEYGGYFTCLDRCGNVFDTDKFVWLQARQVWMFSKLYNNIEKNEEWLNVAKLGYEFLRKHAIDRKGNWYFSLDRIGRPLIQPYNIYSDFFGALAFYEYSKASGDKRALRIAKRTYKNIQRRYHNPKGKWNKAYPGTRPMMELALPMMDVYLSTEMLDIGDKKFRNYLVKIIEKNIKIILNNFVDKEKNIMYNNAGIDGSHPDSFEGRCINPGHGIECVWMIATAALKLDLKEKDEIIRRMKEVLLSTLEFGWDKEYGGIFYFMDIKGKPPLQLEWDRKLWWVHCEALYSTLFMYELTKDQKLLEWYSKLYEYTWKHFPDPEYGEWFGYLNRRGEVFLNLKGGKWKGCFHVPRTLYLCYRLLDKGIEAIQQ